MLSAYPSDFCLDQLYAVEWKRQGGDLYWEELNSDGSGADWTCVILCQTALNEAGEKITGCVDGRGQES